MEWHDNALVLSARKHGEHNVLLQVYSENHGRTAGLVRGGAGSRHTPMMQPGNALKVRWRARLEEHLGTFTCEMTHAYAAHLMHNPLMLAGMQAACQIVREATPERDPCHAIFDSTRLLFACRNAALWPWLYVRWELGLLGVLGFGLDLTACAATGGNEDLVYISPRTGQAVSGAAGAPWHDKLLSLPPFLLEQEPSLPSHKQPSHKRQLTDAFTLSGYFLHKNVLSAGNVGNTQGSASRARDHFVRYCMQSMCI